MRMTLAILVLLISPAAWALGQSSSLYRAHLKRVSAKESATTKPSPNGSLRANAGTTANPRAPRNMAVAKVSLTAVSPPEPEQIKVNDHVGIIVRHRYRAQTDATLEQESEWDVNSRLAAWFRIHDRKWVQQDFERGTPHIEFANRNELENEGRSDRRDIVETRMMGKVIDVKPNGNLTVVGYYRIGTGKDTQQVVMMGEVNSREIGPDRTVTSDKIFGLKFDTIEEGAVDDATKRGWLKTALDAIKPF